MSILPSYLRDLGDTPYARIGSSSPGLSPSPTLPRYVDWPRELLPHLSNFSDKYRDSPSLETLDAGIGAFLTSGFMDMRSAGIMHLPIQSVRYRAAIKTASATIAPPALTVPTMYQGDYGNPLAYDQIYPLSYHFTNKGNALFLRGTTPRFDVFNGSFTYSGCRMSSSSYGRAWVSFILLPTTDNNMIDNPPYEDAYYYFCLGAVLSSGSAVLNKYATTNPFVSTTNASAFRASVFKFRVGDVVSAPDPTLFIKGISPINSQPLSTLTLDFAEVILLSTDAPGAFLSLDPNQPVMPVLLVRASVAVGSSPYSVFFRRLGDSPRTQIGSAYARANHFNYPHGFCGGFMSIDKNVSNTTQGSWGSINYSMY